MVVIAIVAILAAILLPALSRAKAIAHRTQCQNRMKQWTLAFLTYADEHEGLIPREGYEPLGRVYWDNWGQVRGRILSGSNGRTDSQDVWYNALPGAYLPGIHPASWYSWATNRADFYDASSFFHCPAARIPPKARNPSYQIPLFSIAMNSQLIRFPRIPTMNVAAITRPDRTVVFLDNRLEGEKKIDPYQANSFLGQPSSYAGRAVARHLDTCNLAFADGHVGFFPGNQVVATSGPNRGWAILPANEIAWDP